MTNSQYLLHFFNKGLTFYLLLKGGKLREDTKDRRARSEDCSSPKCEEIYGK